MKNRTAVALIDKLQTAETTLNFLVTYERGKDELLIAVVTHPSLLTGNSEHPLVKMIFSKFDVVIYQSFGFVKIWNKSISSSKTKLPFAIRLPFSKPSVFLGLLRSKSFADRLGAKFTKLNVNEAEVIFEVLSPLNFSFLDCIENKTFLGISHSSGGFLEKNDIEIERRNSTMLENLKAIEDQRVDSKAKVYLFPRLLDSISAELRGQVNFVEMPKLSYGWLDYVESNLTRSHHSIWDSSSTKGFALLISRRHSNNSTQRENPSKKNKKQMMREIAEVVEALGLKPVIIPHPIEKRQSTGFFVKKSIQGWQIAPGVHYLSMVKNANLILTFGTQLVEDCWILGHTVIEYRTDWVELETIFSRRGMSKLCRSQIELGEVCERLLGEGK